MRRRDLSRPRQTNTSAKSAATANKGNGDSIRAPDVWRWTGFLLHRVYQVAQSLYESGMAELDLRPNQVGILQLLGSEGPMVQARLGEKLGVDKASIVPSVNDLEDRGFVRRANHPDDGRAFIVRITEPGRRMLVSVDKGNKKVTEQLLGPLSLIEKEQLHALLRKLVEHHVE